MSGVKTMREQMAKTMFDKNNMIAGPGMRGTWNERGRERYLALADAALDALLRPNALMIAAMIGEPITDENGVNCFRPYSLSEGFKVAIKAARDGA